MIHTPDFLVLKANEVGLVECKTEDDLQKLAITQPGRYRPALEGGWRCPPGEVAVCTLGFSYRVWSSGEIDPTLLRNIRFLGDYLAPDYPDLPVSLRKQIARAVMKAPGTSAKRLVEDGQGWTYEDVFTLIGKHTLYVDLREAPFTQLDRVRIFPDEQTALAIRFARLSRAQHDEPASSPVPQPSNAPGAATALVAHPVRRNHAPRTLPPILPGVVLQMALWLQLAEATLKAPKTTFKCQQNCQQEGTVRIVPGWWEDSVGVLPG